MLSRGSAGHLELDPGALGIADVDRRPGAGRAGAHGRRAHGLDVERGEMARHGLEIDRREHEAHVIDVRAFEADRRARDQIDHAPTRTQLDEADRLEAPLLRQPEHARVEVEHPRLVAAAQHDVIELRHDDRRRHRVRHASARGRTQRSDRPPFERSGAAYGMGTYSTLGRRAIGCGKSCMKRKTSGGTAVVTGKPSSRASSTVIG